MTGTRTLTTVVSLVGGMLYWLAVASISGAAEPWDGAGFWRLWYPASLLIVAVLGFLLGRNGWLAAAMLVLALLPVLWLGSGVGPLFMVGLLFAGALALPAVAIAFAASLAAMRVRRA